MAHHNQHQCHQFTFDELYCEEERWEELATGECFTDEEESSCINPPSFFELEQEMSWEDDELSNLLSKEKDNELCLGNSLVETPSFAEARKEAISWMLKVVAHYSFSAQTALLAINYLDRFLFSFQSHREKPWLTQLSAVACLSVAAKVEETQVPLLLDFQVEQPRYLFEAKTIQRMEILVLSTLEWKMNPVTPISFLDYIIRRLGLKNHLSWQFPGRCEHLLLAIISDCQFTCYRPSVMSAATMLHVISNVEPSTLPEFQDQLLGILGIDKGKVENCCKVIRDVAASVHFDYYHIAKKRKFSAALLPGSPKRVMDVSFSSSSSQSESSNESWTVASSSSSSSVSSSPEHPLSKRGREDTGAPHFSSHFSASMASHPDT